MIGWESAISALLSLVIFLLGILLRKMCVIEAKLDAKQSLTGCEGQRKHCEKLYSDTLTEDVRGLWSAFNAHSHTGLKPESRVTR